MSDIAIDLGDIRGPQGERGPQGAPNFRLEDLEAADGHVPAEAPGDAAGFFALSSTGQFALRTASHDGLSWQAGASLQTNGIAQATGAWTAGANAVNSPPAPTFKRAGRIVQLYININHVEHSGKSIAPTLAGQPTIAAIPDGYRPAWQTFGITDVGGNLCVLLAAGADIKLFYYPSTTPTTITDILAGFCYLAAD